MDSHFKCINELFIQFINSRNAQAAGTTNTANSTSNVRSTSVKSKEGTTITPQKRTASPSGEDKPIKKLMKTSTNDKSDANSTTSYHFVGVTISSTPNIKPTVAERYEGEINISALGNATTLTSENKSNKVSSTEASKDFEQSVNTENVQIENTNNIGNDLINNSVMIFGEIPETVTINQEEKDSQVEVSSEGLNSCSLSNAQTINTENVQTQNTNNTGSDLINNSVMISGEIPETVTINEEENACQVEVSSEGLYSCSLSNAHTVNAENVQTQNTYNIGNDLINNSVMISGEIPKTVTINQEEKACQVELSSEGLHSCSICYEQTDNTENVQNQITNNIERNLIDTSVMMVGEKPETPKTTTTSITINDEGKDSQQGWTGLNWTRWLYGPVAPDTKSCWFRWLSPPSHPVESVPDSQVEVSAEDLHCCPICFNILKNKEISATTCGHVFCKACILSVIAKSKKCPICLRPLTKRNIRPLFM